MGDSITISQPRDPQAEQGLNCAKYIYIKERERVSRSVRFKRDKSLISVPLTNNKIDFIRPVCLQKIHGEVYKPDRRVTFMPWRAPIPRTFLFPFLVCWC